MDRFVASNSSSSLSSNSSGTSSDTSSLVKSTFKTADQIRCRLFDHRQFTTGEINFTLKNFEETKKDVSPQILLNAAIGIDESFSKLNELENTLDSKLDETKTRLENLVPWVDEMRNQMDNGYESAQKRMDIERDHLERTARLTEEFNERLIQGKSEIDDHFRNLKGQLLQQYNSE